MPTWSVLRTICLAVCFAFASRGISLAVPVTVEFTGEVTSLSHPALLEPLFPIGGDGLFLLTYDTEWTGSPTFGYALNQGDGQTNYSVAVAGNSYATNGAGSGVLRAPGYGLASSNGLVVDTSISGTAFAQTPVGSTPLYLVAVDLAASWAGASFGGLPTSIPQSGLTGDFLMYFSYAPFEGSSDGVIVRGQLTDAKQVPTPSSALLVGLGLIGVGARYGRSLRNGTRRAAISSR